MNWGFLFRYIRDNKGSPEFLQQRMNDNPLEQRVPSVTEEEMIP